MLKTRVRASLERPGPRTPPRRTARMFQPHRMPNAHGAGRPHATQQGPKVKPPQKSPTGTTERRKTNPTGDSQKPPGDLREPRFGRSHFLQTVADTARPWGSQIVQPPVRGNRQSWRVETGGKPLRTKNQKKRETPQHLPPPKTGPEAPKSRWGVNILRHLQKGSETRPSASHPSRSPPLPPSGWPPTLTSPGCSG